MNSGKLRPIDEALQNIFQFFPEETRSPLRTSRSSPLHALEEENAKVEPKVSDFEKAANPEQMTKKQLKKLKQKQNKQGTQMVSSTEERTQKPAADRKSQMSEILFKSNVAMVDDFEEFKVEDLFSQTVLSSGLHRLIPPTFLSLSPREIYE